jgi:hypothetical protein
MDTKAQILVDKLLSFWKESTSPCPHEIRDDMLSQIHALVPTLDPGEAQEFADFVQFMGAKMLSYTGTTEDILQRLQPWSLQLILQRFKTPAISPLA